MLPPLATLADLSARVPGGISGAADEARAEAALVDASSKVRAIARKTWTTEDEDGTAGPALDADVPDIVVTVTLSAARRSYINPEGLTGENVGSYGYTQANASPDVYLTAAEERMVRSAAGISGLGTQPTTRSATGRTDNLVDVVGSDEPLPVEYPGPTA